MLQDDDALLLESVKIIKLLEFCVESGVEGPSAIKADEIEMAAAMGSSCEVGTVKVVRYRRHGSESNSGGSGACGDFN